MKNSVKMYRKKMHWTQEQFAKNLGKSLSYVKKLETGRISPSIAALMEMKNLFGCETIDEILQAS